MAPGLLGAALAITTVAATLQGTIGFGFSILSVPTLSLIDPRLAPVPQMLVVVPLVTRMAWRERHAIDLRGVAWIVVGRFPGAAAGALLVAVATPRVTDWLMAGIVLFAVAVLSTGYDIPRNRGTQLLAGTASGLMSRRTSRESTAGRRRRYRADTVRGSRRMARSTPSGSFG